MKIPNFALAWAWRQVQPNLKTWLTTRALQLPAAREQVYALDMAMRFGLKTPDGAPDVERARAILKDVEGTLQGFAIASMDAITLGEGGTGS